MSRKRVCYFAAGSAFLLAVATAPPARASEFAIGGDFDWVYAGSPYLMTGLGGAVRLGPRLHVPLLVTAPEIGVSYHSFSGKYAPDIYRGIAGLRIGVGEIIRGGVYGHLGVGRLEGVDDSVREDRTRTAFTWDAGLALDLTFIPIVDVGAHAAYARLSGDDVADGFGWLIFGLHASVIL